MINRLMEDLKESMRNKEKSRKEVIQLIIGKAKNLAKDSMVEVDNMHVLSAVNSELKQTRDALSQMRAHLSDDKVADYEYKISVIESYLPKQLSEQEISEEIDKLMADSNIPKEGKSMGVIIKLMKDKFGMAVDGKMLSTVTKNKLS